MVLVPTLYPWEPQGPADTGTRRREDLRLTSTRTRTCPGPGENIEPEKLEPNSRFQSSSILGPAPILKIHQTRSRQIFTRTLQPTRILNPTLQHIRILNLILQPTRIHKLTLRPTSISSTTLRPTRIHSSTLQPTLTTKHVRILRKIKILSLNLTPGQDVLLDTCSRSQDAQCNR